MPRHLLMHCYPRRGGAWRRSVQHVLRRIDQFDGRRIVSVAVDQSTERAGEVSKEFGGLVDIHETHNNASQEMVSFGWLLEQVASEPGISFYCHSKGATQPAHVGSHCWCDAMAITCLDYPQLIDIALRNKATCGAFRSNVVVPGFGPWHFAGTWYWMRHNRLFGRDWKPKLGAFYGAEAYPGLLFAEKESACLFTPKAHLSHMYNNGWWETVGGPSLRRWVARLEAAGHKPLCVDSPNTELICKALR